MTDRLQVPPLRQPGVAALRWVLGGLLLLAAGFKGYALATGPLVDQGFWANRPLMSAAVGFEALLGLWLLGGFWPRLAGRVAFCCFLAFAGLSLAKGLGGAVSCGCFGRVPVNPWITFGVDLAALPAAWWIGWRASRARPRLLWTRLAVAALLIMGVVLPACYRMVFYRAPERPDLELVVLDPQEWIGKPWPLARYADVAPQLARGKWAVLLYSLPCGHCFSTVRDYAELGWQWDSANAPARVALINTSGGEEPPNSEWIPKTPALRGSLDLPQAWFIVSPTLVLLADGRVAAVAEGEDDCRWEDGKFQWQ